MTHKISEISTTEKDDDYIARLLVEEQSSTKLLGLKEHIHFSKPVFHLVLIQIERVVRFIEPSNPDENSLNHYIYHCSKILGINKADPSYLLWKMVSALEHTHKEFHYSEYLSCILDAVNMMQLKSDNRNRSAWSPAFGNEPLLLLEILVKEIWKNTTNPAFIRRCDQRKRRLKRTEGVIKSYALNLLHKYKRLLVLRVDFAYLNEHASTVSESEARSDLARLFAYRRHNRDLLPDMVGYVVHLEWELLTRFHFHVFFFLDGDLHQKDAYLAHQLGKYWENVITKGKGRFYNCNLSKHEYDSCGIGMINLNRPNEVESLLEKALGYVLKKEKYLVAKELGQRKSTWRGFMPKKINEVN